MSVVTTVVLFCHGKENLDTIHGWLSSHGKSELQLLSDCFGGSKRPEIHTYGAAYNMLDDRGLVELFLRL